MGRLLEIITPLHKKTKRNYIGRMTDEKVKCMKVAKKYGYDSEKSFIEDALKHRILTLKKDNLKKRNFCKK